MAVPKRPRTATCPKRFTAYLFVALTLAWMAHTQQERHISLPLVVPLLGTNVDPTTVSQQQQDSSPQLQQPQIKQPQPPQNCVIHIHGLHHCGTGLLRETIYQQLGGEDQVSRHTVLPELESEGQHLQKVYPAFNKRQKYCLPRAQRESETSLGKLYYCPPLESLVANDPQKAQAMGQQLWNQWSSYWDLDKPYLIQKTPTMDLVFLERTTQQLRPTVHLLVLGHPLVGHTMEEKATRPPHVYATVWLDAWSHVLQQALPKVQSYAIVTFESLLLHRDQVARELADLVHAGCSNNHTATTPYDAGRPRRRRRRLNFHRFANATEFIRPSAEKLARLTDCPHDPGCPELQTDLAAIMRPLGYTWDPDRLFVDTTQPQRRVLFSSRNPPPPDWVKELVALAAKYTT